MKTFYLSILAFLWLTGCASHTYLLIKEDSASFVGGELIPYRGEGSRLVLQAANRRYEARDLIVERHTNLAALRKRYYVINPKHWERISAGFDTDHVTYSTEIIAKSEDGHELSCRLTWGGGAKPAGVCTDQAGAAFPVRFE
jgi:hypothetical protein